MGSNNCAYKGTAVDKRIQSIHCDQLVSTLPTEHVWTFNAFYYVLAHVPASATKIIVTKMKSALQNAKHLPVATDAMFTLQEWTSRDVIPSVGNIQIMVFKQTVVHLVHKRHEV